MIHWKKRTDHRAPDYSEQDLLHSMEHNRSPKKKKRNPTEMKGDKTNRREFDRRKSRVQANEDQSILLSLNSEPTRTEVQEIGRDFPSPRHGIGHHRKSNGGTERQAM